MKLKQILNVKYYNVKKIIPFLNKKEKSWFERYILVRLVLDERPLLSRGYISSATLTGL